MKTVKEDKSNLSSLKTRHNKEIFSEEYCSSQSLYSPKLGKLI